MNRYDLDGRVALVTGGASGLGAACAAALSSNGATVAVLDLRTEGLPGYTVSCDVADSSQVDNAIVRVEHDLGPIDVLVHAAGISLSWGDPLDISDDEWRRILAVNLDGTYFVCRALLPRMRARGYGRAILFASTAGKDGHASIAAYAASKAGVIALAKSLGRHLAPAGVLVNAITPGAFETPLSTNLPEHVQQGMRGSMPIGRLGQPEEVAEMVCWLATEGCSFSAGAIFDLSGGRSVY